MRVYATALAVLAVFMVALSAFGAGSIFAQTPPPGTATATAVATTSATPAGSATAIPTIAPQATSTPAVAQVSVCTLTQPDVRIAGGQTATLNNVTLRLPTGSDFIVAMISRGGVSRIEVCYLADSSTLILDASSGREISRDGRSSAANRAFDQIVDSAQQPSSGAQITPPNTGGAGLR